MNGDTSQYGESQFICDHFASRIGRFLDVGAFDGKTFSNTWPLAELGWAGVCVEPSPPAFCALMRNYACNGRVELVNAAVMVSKRDETILHEFHCNTSDGYAADALSSFEKSHVAKFSPAGHPFRKIYIPHIDWWDLEQTFGDWADDPFQFINIDVEGQNAAALGAMPFRPEMICVEYDPDADGVNTVHSILTGWGYRWRVIGGNVLGVRG